jgi:sulfur-oxidizing protein SoxA
MLADGNPADLFEAKGEALWKQQRGPKNASLEKPATWARVRASSRALRRAAALLCRHRPHAGPGVAPADLHGNPAGLQRRGRSPPRRFGQGEQANIDGLVAYLSAESRGLKFNLPQDHVEERKSYELGKRAFFFRGGPTTFPARPATAKTASASACRTCPT